MASNFVGVGRMDEVQRWVKKKAQFLMVSRPEVVKLYNEAMGGVDLLDQLVSLWLEYRLDAKRANIQTKDIEDLLHFKMNVAQCLVFQVFQGCQKLVAEFHDILDLEHQASELLSRLTSY
ncbi:piggyBac transposable element-derived protein 3-like [Scomber scombrus]|uniref:PiggyBac transposable element-derived protein 3-like n=1 Tax=Scomber scombrus TaxID=13677 RepID=A0AAV1P4Z9_SCOSC